MSQSNGLRLILVLVGSSLAAPASQLPVSSPAEPTGSVRGIVLEATGKPLPHATVYAVPQGDVKKQFHTESNDAGEFVLDGLPKGSFFVSAFKESDGHPYNFFSFFASPQKMEQAYQAAEIKRPDETGQGDHRGTPGHKCKR